MIFLAPCGGAVYMYVCIVAYWISQRVFIVKGHHMDALLYTLIVASYVGLARSWDPDGSLVPAQRAPRSLSPGTVSSERDHGGRVFFSQLYVLTNWRSREGIKTRPLVNMPHMMNSHWQYLPADQGIYHDDIVRVVLSTGSNAATRHLSYLASRRSWRQR
ncbi:hypothetical protein EV363DRAFT_237341 [Boletus edulis]|nr:hypothetical protein EV363DRAFT_237341 [Boletus edulis]